MTFRIPAYNINCVINLNQRIMIITTQQELNDLIATADKSNTIVLDDELEINFDCKIPCNINAFNIKAHDIDAWNIKASDINACDINAEHINAHNIKTDKIDAINIKTDKIDAHDIKAWNITAHDIKAHNIITNDIKAHNIITNDINAYDINAWNIKASDIKACDIKAYNITAKNIKYHAFCIAYESLKCKSIAGRRENSFHKCLDQKIEIVKKEEKVTIELTQSQLDKIKHLI